jgi:hypothetical protein
MNRSKSSREESTDKSQSPAVTPSTSGQSKSERERRCIESDLIALPVEPSSFDLNEQSSRARQFGRAKWMIDFGTKRLFKKESANFLKPEVLLFACLIVVKVPYDFVYLCILYKYRVGYRARVAKLQQKGWTLKSESVSAADWQQSSHSLIEQIDEGGEAKKAEMKDHTMILVVVMMMMMTVIKWTNEEWCKK